jgi:hypothetical protein
MGLKTAMMILKLISKGGGLLLEKGTLQSRVGILGKTVFKRIRDC